MEAGPLEAATQKALDAFGDRGSRELLRRMAEERRLYSTECRSCGRVAWPPRMHCPFCGHDEVSWTEIGEGASLYAFTTQDRALRFAKPQVIGLVQLPRVGIVLSAIDARFEDLEIGMALELDFVQIAEGLWVHRFKPAPHAQGSHPVGER